MRGANKFGHILSAFYGTPWAILPAKLLELETVLWTRIRTGEGVDFVHHEQNPDRVTVTGSGVEFSHLLPRSEASTVTTERTDKGYVIAGNVAIIPITGTITPRPTFMQEFSGGTSHANIGAATENALADGKVESIVYDIDSPGGMVFGQEETAPKVFAAQKKKPTTGVANYMAASAAYWYLSQCGEAVCSPSGMVGCIGVLMQNVDETKALEMSGVRSDLISNKSSPYKSEGYPQVPVTPEALADIQKTCDLYAETFVNAVAKGRNKRPATVEANFGKGRMLLAAPALDAGMIDRIATMEEVLQQLHKATGRTTKRNIAATLARAGLPTA